MSKFDPRKGDYLRVANILIHVLPNMQHVEAVVHHEWVRVNGKKVQRLKIEDMVPPLSFTARMDSIERYPIFDPATGDEFPLTTCDREVMAALLSAIHQRRKNVI